MRIAFICYDYPPGPNGGIGRFTQVLGQSLARRGHAVRVTGVYPEHYAAPDRQDDDGVSIWRLRDPGRRGSWLRARWQLYRQVRTWARAGEVDLVEAPDCYGWLAGWPRMEVPLVARAHGSLTYFASELGQPVNRTGHWLERRSLRRADAWAAVSAHVGRCTQELFGLPKGPDTVLFNPVHGSPAAERARVPGRVVFTGSLTAKKGVVTLADAWPQVVAAVPEARLVLIGKDLTAPQGGSMQRHLMQRLPPQLHGTVEFRGHVPAAEVGEALATASVAVFPSFTESFGLGAAEAMAHACPTIYTSRSCGPEILQNGVEGLLVDPADPAALAGAIVRLLRDPALATRLGAAAGQRARERFGVGPLTAANEAWYAAVRERFARNGAGAR